jgi:hypothetical protein
MAEKKLIDIGSFEVERARLTNFDGSKSLEIGMLITDVMMAESIHMSYITADFTIYDTHALLDEFPIIGEEFLEFTYTDYFENKITEKFHVVGVDEIIPDEKSESQSFVLRCMSTGFVLSEGKMIRMSLSGLVSDLVQSLHSEYFSNKKIDIEPTDTTQNFVIPAYTPIETINFLARKAFSASSKSSNYMFFENRNQYVFKTHEQIFKDAEVLPARNTFYYGETNVDVRDRQILMNHALRLRFKQRFNLIDEMRSGAMVSEIVRLDPATKNFDVKIYDHGDEFGSYAHSDKKSKNYHTQSFRNKYFSKENPTNLFMTFEDSTRTDLRYSEIIPNRNSTNYYLNKIVLEMEIHGCNDLFAGSVVNLVIPEMKFVNGDKDIHPNLSGRYMIETISHKMEQKQWKMTVRIIKDSFVNG